MALDILAVGALYQSSDISKMRVMAESPKKGTPTPKPFTPLKTKLTTIETKRIMSVLDETIQKVELVTLLSSVAANMELEGLLGEELSRAVREHEDLCQVLMNKVRYLQEEELQLQAEEEFEEEAWFRDLLLSIELQKSNLLPLMGQIRDSTKNILRLLLGNPRAAQLLRARAADRAPGAQGFVDSLVELRGFLFEKLLTSPMEARDKGQFIQDITKRNMRNQEVIDALENELAERMRNRAAEVEKENFVIQELKNHLHQVLKFSENSLTRTKQEAEKQQKADYRASQSRVARIQQDILQLRSQFHSLVMENREAEQALRKKKYKVETEIENWIQKYDTEMTEKQEEYEELDIIHKEEKIQLKELQTRYEVLVEEFSQIREEREINSKKRMEAEQDMMRMVKAATLIQAVWKGYLVRSLLRSKRKKRGKGKGKGEKGKGKGKGKK
ncbi:dynein regulatory complex protein 10 [Pipistrellus kuhlii]|uniref:Dynein regulatory complex protein 10 n=1 Tax=Pipistrellus kuhlii TaxID=59472 RepID=A0A7J7QTM9_PIPKU|nr:dynein regulatory complex protein 10 [Pipistrellus kuhlii]XP_036296101.1 dynein regulatory complex protein 10 [Pipistrellus kuhlii]KAF6266967.1 hypothetical protein mPipKuh1_006781 [Pipistrellus kuhlii]KAF6267179.1 IQ motif containing D [Pipistrellus kuhlii]